MRWIDTIWAVVHLIGTAGGFGFACVVVCIAAGWLIDKIRERKNRLPDIERRLKDLENRQ